MASQVRRLVVCLRADREADLQVRKLYEVRPDVAAAEHGYVRIVDDSGEDYLYPAEWFAPVELAQSLARTLFGRRRGPVTPEPARKAPARATRAARR